MNTEAPNAGASAVAELPPLALVAPEAAVARDLQNQVKIGHAIREHRLRDHRDLQIARQEKQEWVRRCTDLLNKSFNHSGAADQFNNWAAPILPEYAEFGMFAELFNEEMKERLSRLRAIMKSLRSMPRFQPATTTTKTTKGTAMHTLTETNNGAVATADTEQVAPGVTQAMQAAAAQAAQRRMAAASGARSMDKSGMLIVRSDDDPACESVRQFIEQFGLTLHVSKRAACCASAPHNTDTASPTTETAAASLHPLLDELSAMQASPAPFALLFTASAEQPQQSADPDALFDLGCCVGKLGAQRVIVLHRNGEPHVDRFGLTHIVFDPHDGWHLQLARHLKRAGVEVDLNRLI